MGPDETNRAGRFSDAPALGPRQRAGVVLIVAVLHLILIAAVVKGLGGVSAVLTDVGLPPVTQAFDVPLDPPSPTPTATVQSHEAEGAEGAAGRKARPKEIVAARARIPTKAVNAASAASTGQDTRSGATAAGAGTGGGAAGAGTGSGGSGSGAGGRFLAQRAVKIEGDITAARDYPAKTRDQRLGKSVIIALVVGTDGRVTGCSVEAPSGEPQSDAITCRLATQRFRFRPALDQTGAPIASTYRWRQWWSAP